MQCSVGVRSSAVDQAAQALQACTTVSLAPGKTRTVRLATPAIACTDSDAATGWIVEPGEYEVIVGRHSRDDDARRARFVVG